MNPEDNLRQMEACNATGLLLNGLNDHKSVPLLSQHRGFYKYGFHLQHIWKFEGTPMDRSLQVYMWFSHRVCKQVLSHARVRAWVTDNLKPMWRGQRRF